VFKYRGTDCDTDHYLVVAKVGLRDSVNKQLARKFVTEIFNLQNLNDVAVKEHYELKISNRSAPVENLDEDVKISKAWESIKKNIELLFYLFIERVIKLTVVIIGGYQNVNSICR
jgi:hypothetical protein